MKGDFFFIHDTFAGRCVLNLILTDATASESGLYIVGCIIYTLQAELGLTHERILYPVRSVWTNDYSSCSLTAVNFSGARSQHSRAIHDCLKHFGRSARLHVLHNGSSAL